MTAGAPEHLFLVIPAGAVHPMTGGGNRSRVIFLAMRAFCPVTVVIVGVERETEAGTFFPGAARVVGIPDASFALHAGGLRDRIRTVGRRLLRPASNMAARPALRDELQALVGAQGRAVVVFRYFITFARSGLVDDPEGSVRVVVDVDDRDDLKMDGQVRARLGERIGPAVSRLLSPRILSLMVSRLRDAGQVWLAKEADLFDAAGLPQTVVPNAAPPVQEVGDAAQGTTLLSVASAGHLPNRAAVSWFLDTVWPSVRAACPEAECRIVGFGDWSSVAERHGTTPGVTIVGTVESVADEYRRARVAIAPIREGGGSQIKVIEACAFARPVVATTMAGHGFGPAIASVIAPTDDPAAFAARCIAYLSDPALATETGRRLQALQRRDFAPESVSERIVRNVTTFARVPLRAGRQKEAPL